VKITQGRFLVTEGQNSSDISNAIRKHTSISTDVLHAQINNLNERLRLSLGLEQSPITVSSTGQWRIDGIAGLLRLNSETEIEVIPKFLTQSEDWQRDFFLISTLVRTGRLLNREHISTGVGERGDLAMLVARALIAGHLSNQRKPIRNYKVTQKVDFSFEGEVDLESLLMPEADGYKIQKIELTNDNEYSAVLKSAIEILLNQIGAGDTRSILIRILSGLRSNSKMSSKYSKLPARYAAWNETFELSKLVINGMGLDLAGGGFGGPGFVLTTWQAWQQLCDEAILRAFKNLQGATQHPFFLGNRSRAELNVRPDLTIFKGGLPVLLLDAKYKTRFDRKEFVTNADIYEALAFMNASKCDKMILLYPDPTPDGPLGNVRVFEQIEIEDKHITAVTIQIRGISKSNGFDQLVETLKSGLLLITGDISGSSLASE
jgi:5-methylcytosine-specific restriction endonuclease McrBC regulatory subunit McrC